MTKENKKLILLFLAILIFIVLAGKFISFPCLFKKYLNIPCPGCGLSRAFRCIFDFKLIDAFNYNILAIPLFIILLLFIGLIVYDVLNKTNYFKTVMDKILSKYYVILILLVLSEIVNIIRNI